MKREKCVIQEFLQGAHQCYIYGAGIIAYNIFCALEKLYEIEIEAFIVTDITEERKLAGRQIRCIDDIEPEILRKATILIATPEVYHKDIVFELDKRGIEKYLCINSDIEYGIMSTYYEKNTEFKLCEEMNSGPVNKAESKNICVCMAKSKSDKILTRNYIIPEWIVPIHVGAVLDDTKIAILSDATGDNISFKNKKYSELTATYWLWKNTKYKVKGICHYRRMLQISDKVIEMLQLGVIDAVLPLPFVCPSNTFDQFERYISENDYNLMMEILRDMVPEYYEEAKKIYAGKYIYNYNMLVAREEVFNSYCAWLFPILQKIEESEARLGIRHDRYLGYLGEILTSLYFLYWKDQMKIVHAKKIWMI